MPLTGPSDIDEALQKVGELLALEKAAYAIVVAGGAALNLLGLIERVTRDVDILAFAQLVGGEPTELVEAPRLLPEPLFRVARTVARDLGLQDEWLNTNLAPQWDLGLPPDLLQRVRWRRYAALQVGLVDRQDLIFLKLFAAADWERQGSVRSVHYQDLVALKPSADELEAATAWVSTQEASPEFPAILEKVVSDVRNDLRFNNRAEPERTR